MTDLLEFFTHYITPGLYTLLLASTQDKFSVFVSEAQGIDSSNSDTAEGAVSPKQDALVIRHSAGPFERHFVKERHTSELHIKCEAVSIPVGMECFPFRYGPYVTMQRGSSGRRAHCKLYFLEGGHN